MDHNESNETFKSLDDACSSVQKVELKDDALLKKYIVWENSSNCCWLNASMALVAHNTVMKKYCEISPDCKISQIIKEYEEAMVLLNKTDKNFNESLKLAKRQLVDIQKKTLTYLKPILKFEIGHPESAFCSLYNLLMEDSIIKDIFDVTWLSVKECTNCGDCSASKKKKPIITLSEIHSFDPKNPSVLYNCPCNKSVQKLKLVFVGLPPCLIFHFENGAGKENPPLTFTTQEREYQLTGIMTLEKSQESSVNHFITWVRDPFVNKWLDCNDLNIDIISYSSGFPDIKFQDVFIYVYESFDEKLTIINRNVDYKKNNKANAISLIDLSEESKSENSHSQISSKDTESTEIPTNSHLQDNASFVKSGRDKSENSNSENVSESDKDTRKMEISALNSQLQDTSVELDKNKSDNNSSPSFAPGSNTDTRKVEISASESLQGNISSVEPGRDKFEKNSSLNNIKDDIRKIEICTSDLQLQDNVTSVISDSSKSLEIGNTTDNMPTFTDDKEITQTDFLQSLKTAASGTSYVKLSVRKRKSGVPLQKNSVNEVNNPDSGENSSTTIYSPSCSKSQKETRSGLDEDYVPSGVPKTKQNRRISNAVKAAKNTKRGCHNSKAKGKFLKTGLRKSFPVKSKLKRSAKIPRRKKSSQINPKLKAISKKEIKEEVNSDHEGIKILKDYENDLTCNSDSECELATFEEEIDAVVDFTFAYICELSRRMKKH